MASLLDDPYAPRGAGLLGVPLPEIKPPDDRQISEGDALAQTYSDVMAAMERQRRISTERGLWEGGGLLEGGHPTQAGVADAVQQASMNLLLSTSAPGFRMFHGSPHSFDRFDSSKIGTGEGNQAYGHGMYGAGHEPVAESYLQNAEWSYGRQKAQTLYDRLQNPALERGLDNEGWSKLNAQRGFWEKVALGRSPRTIIDDVRNNPGEYGEHEAAYALSLDPNKFKRKGGHMYEVQVNADPERFLHWDKPLHEQHPDVQAVFGKDGPLSFVSDYLAKNPNTPTSGMHIEDILKMSGHSPAGAAAAMREAGIPGIRYLDQGSRGAGEGTSNYVVFDDSMMEILRKYGLAGLILGGGAAAAGSQQPQQ